MKRETSAIGGRIKRILGSTAVKIFAAGGELEQTQFERYLGCKQRIRGAVNDRRLAKIFKRRGNNIEAGRRGAAGNGRLGGAFSTSGQGRGLNFLFPDGCVLNDNARRTR